MKLLRAFIGDWKTIGAIAPTSRFAQAAMLDAVPLQSARLVVELGAGTGCITRTLLQWLPVTARLLAVERNEQFANSLRATVQDVRLEVICASAEDLPEVLISRGDERADCIVSTLPFTSLGREMSRKILQAVREALAPCGSFVTLQYNPFFLPPLLKQQFGSYRTQLCLWNLPPAFILSCRVPMQ